MSSKSDFFNGGVSVGDVVFRIQNTNTLGWAQSEIEKALSAANGVLKVFFVTGVELDRLLSSKSKARGMHALAAASRPESA